MEPIDAAELRAAIANVTRALASCSTEQVLELVRARAMLSRELHATDEQGSGPSREHVA